MHFCPQLSISPRRIKGQCDLWLVSPDAVDWKVTAVYGSRDADDPGQIAACADEQQADTEYQRSESDFYRVDVHVLC